MPDEASHEEAIRRTRDWVERAVIGLNLCPFAKAVQVKGLIHYVVSDAAKPEQLLAAVASELDALAACDIGERETTLLIAPQCLHDFLDFNDFLDEAEGVIADRGLEGEFQLASFHPQFQFAGTAPNDVANYTNRSPYPTLHLLREESIDRAVAAFPNAESIYEENIRTLEHLGHEGWQALRIGERK